MSKKNTPFTTKMLNALGFFEYDKNKFGRPDSLTADELAKSKQLEKDYRKEKRAKRIKPQDKVDTFIKLIKITFEIQLRPEYQFHEIRMWRFDYAFIEGKIAVEVEGGIWTHGRHTRGKGYKSDMEKYSTAASMGWIVLRCEPADLMEPSTTELFRLALLERGYTQFK